MKKVISILVLGVMFTSCVERAVWDKNPQIVKSVNSMDVEENFRTEECLYMVRTENITLATDSLYRVGDTLKIGKKQ